MPFLRSQRNNAPQQTPQQHYKSLRRGNITSAGKTATVDKLLTLAASNNTTEKKVVTDVVRNLLDFKAAEKANNRNTINTALRGVRAAIPQANNQGLTYDECLELAKNRSGLFQRKLPDTLKRLVDNLMLLSLPSPGLITDINRAFLIDCGLREKVNLANPSQQLKHEFEEHLKKTKECFLDINIRNSITHRLEYHDIFERAVIDCKRQGGASQGTGNQEPFLCGQPMRLPPHHHNQPILQVAAEWTRLQMLRSSRPDTNSLITSNQAIAQARLNRSSGVVKMNDMNEYHKPEFANKKTSLANETKLYLHSKGLWRQDNELSTGRPRLTTAHAAVAVTACSAQYIPLRLPRAFEGNLQSLYMARRMSPGSPYMPRITEDEHRITQDFAKFCENHQITMRGSPWIYNSYDNSRKQLSTTVYYRIDSGAEGGAAFRLFYKETLPYHVSFDDPKAIVIEPLYHLIDIEEVHHPYPTYAWTIEWRNRDP